MTKQRVGVVGRAGAAKALARGLERAGHEVRVVPSDAEGVREVASWCDIVFLAAPAFITSAVLKRLAGALEGKTLADVTSALEANARVVLGLGAGGARQLQHDVPGARVVKVLTVVLPEAGPVAGQAVTAVVTGDDAGAKRTVMELARDVGFETVDAGPLENARVLESTPVLSIRLGYFLGGGAAKTASSTAGIPATLEVVEKV